MELNKIYNEDCLEGMKRMPDKSVDMILCDLPYGTTACSWDTIIPFDPLWEQYERIIKDNGAIVLTATQPFTSALVMSNPNLFKYEWIWQKNSTSGFALAKKQPMRNHESVLVFYKKQCTYNYIKEPRLVDENSKKRMEYDFTSLKGNNQINNGLKKVRYVPEDKNLSYPKTVQFFKNVANNSKQRVHPTQKPVELFEYLIKTYTDEGEMVLDNCMGSGTTAIACINTGRDYIGFELDETYYKKSLERIKNHKTQTDIFDVLEVD